MADRFVYGERIHLTAYAFAGLKRYFQIVSGNFYRQRISDGLASAFLILDPGRQRQGDPTGRPSTRNLMSTASAWRVAMATISA